VTGPFGVAPPERVGAGVLPDGRTLAWSEWGPPDGATVLFCTGAGMSGSLGFGADALPELGVRLVGLDRPGLGRSSPDPGRTLATWADDVAAVFGGGAGLRAVGFSQGAPFALALAARGLVRAVSLVSGQDDLGHPALQPLLPDQVAGMVRLARADPDRLAADVAAAASADWLHGLVLALSGEADREVYASRPFDAAYRRCLAEGFAQGPAGYARDTALALGEWPFRVERVGVPVLLRYGALDGSPVHSPDHGRTLAARLPRATLRVDAGEGGALPWRRGPEILADLLSAAA
jgi:pimeloyl-ACP methyl ester carboxylesterase